MNEDEPITTEISRRTVIETGTTALLLTTLPRAAFAAEAALAVPVARHQEQKTDIAKGHRDDDPALQHKSATFA